jgi:glycosyltransferase involved in cell wall biosynthesis
MSVKAPVIANDCLSGPREILFNKADLDQNIDKYQIADYGIIVPLKNTKEPDWINYPLTTDGENWLQALKKILEDEELQNELKEKSSQRAKDFSLDRGRENWMRLVEKVSK